MKKLRKIIIPLVASVVLSAMFAPCAFADYLTPEYNPDTKTIVVDSSDDFMWLSEYSQRTEPDATGIAVTFKDWTINVTENITLSSWTPISTFEGTIDGSIDDSTNAVISGMNVNTTTAAAGFCSTAAGAQFKNLTISNSTIYTNQEYAGAFAGDGFTSSFTNCEAKNVTITGKRFVGGIVGSAYGNITDCTVTADNVEGSKILACVPTAGVLSNNGDNIGGIIGYIGEGNTVISGCTVINTLVEGARQVGGIAGLENYGNTITECTVLNSNICSKASKTLGVSAGGNRTPAVGGVVGQYNSSTETTKIYTTKCNVENTTVSQSLSTNKKYIGWLVGDAIYGNSSTVYEVSGNTQQNVTLLFASTTLTTASYELGNK